MTEITPRGKKVAEPADAGAATKLPQTGLLLLVRLGLPVAQIFPGTE